MNNVKARKISEGLLELIDRFDQCDIGTSFFLVKKNFNCIRTRKYFRNFKVLYITYLKRMIEKLMINITFLEVEKLSFVLMNARLEIIS